MLEVFDVSQSLTWRSQSLDRKDKAEIFCTWQKVIYHGQKLSRKESHLYCIYFIDIIVKNSMKGISSQTNRMCMSNLMLFLLPIKNAV